MNHKENIYVMKTFNGLNQVDHVARRRAPIFDRARRPVNILLIKKASIEELLETL